MKRDGIVYLVGAGPGDVGLLTLRGAELLRQADVVVYDGLVNPALLQFASRSAQIIYGGKHDRTRSVSQEDLNVLLITKAREGKHVVRLKGGDPYVLGRGGEEAEKLVEAGIAFEVVSGVSSAQAAPNYAGIPLTHRDYCSSYTVVTGHEDPLKGEPGLDWQRIARTAGTLVVLMGLKRLRQISELLIAHGRDPDMPVALIRSGTTAQQHVVEATLATAADAAAQARLLPPVIIIIGDVVKLRAKLNWFEKRSLHGQRIVVTLARHQAAPLSRLLRERGADVLEVPAMKYLEPRNPQPMENALRRLHEFDWIIFSSPTSVNTFFDAFFRLHTDWRDLGKARIGSYGPQTTAQLEQLHLRVDASPADHYGPLIEQALLKHAPIQGAKIMLVRPERASSKVPAHLEKCGAVVEDIPFYRTEVETEDPAGHAHQLLSSGADWITFAAYPDVYRFNERFDLSKLIHRFPRLKLATFGPKTTQLIRELGLESQAEADTATIEGLVASLERVSRIKSQSPHIRR